MLRIVSQGSPACRSLFWLGERSTRMHLVRSPVRHVTWGACRAGAGVPIDRAGGNASRARSTCQGRRIAGWVLETLTRLISGFLLSLGSLSALLHRLRMSPD